jgi:hypothetical protein
MKFDLTPKGEGSAMLLGLAIGLVLTLLAPPAFYLLRLWINYWLL